MGKTAEARECYQDAIDFDGVAADYLNLLAARLNIEFTVRSYPTFREALEGAPLRLYALPASELLTEARMMRAVRGV